MPTPNDTTLLAPADAARGTRLIAAFVIGVVSLTLEIAYTRVISFKLFYCYTYFVIDLALLGLGRRPRSQPCPRACGASRPGG